jgi:2-dehydro-3-deoxy-D-arabinonate dehydratase
VVPRPTGSPTIYTPHTTLKLYNTKSGIAIEHHDRSYLAKDFSCDELVVRDDLESFLEALVAKLPTVDRIALKLEENLLAPIGSQEVWAAGVTYHRSRDARMEESESAGGGNFYDRVYHAERPNFFSKPRRIELWAQAGRLRFAATRNGPCLNRNSRCSSARVERSSVTPSETI